MYNIAYGIVAYSFVSRYSCLEFNCVFSEIYDSLFPYSYLQQYGTRTVALRVLVQYFVTLHKSETYKETIKEKYSTVQYGTVQFSYEYTLRNQRYIHRVRYSYTLRKVRQASGQVRSQQAARIVGGVSPWPLDPRIRNHGF